MEIYRACKKLFCNTAKLVKSDLNDKHKISQINTTAGYNKVEDFYINIEDEENETIELNDMIIPIPNTHTDTNQNILLIIIKLLLLII